jgi:lipoic acid synthetase
MTLMQKFLEKERINTVCENALCPNRGECYKRRTATFLILGKNCTRNCAFCAINKGKPEPVDFLEPERIARATDILNLRHVVITSVTRDDLEDGGAVHFANVIKEIKKLNSEIIIEVLVPDFRGKFESVKKVVDAGPDIFNHNLETVPCLYSKIRKGADYKRSLLVLKTAKKINPQIITKSGLMTGLGETQKQVLKTMDDLRQVRCDFLTIGQYLAPTKKHYPVKEFIKPEVFEKYKQAGIEKGFLNVFSGPFVRSSYFADKQICFTKL